jgi:hypothetical protein
VLGWVGSGWVRFGYVRLGNVTLRRILLGQFYLDWVKLCLFGHRDTRRRFASNVS